MARMDVALSCAFDPVPGDLDEVNEARRLLGARMKPVLELLSREGVTELMINRPEDWWVERTGRMIRVDPVLRGGEIEAVVVLLGKLVGHDLGGRGGERCVNVRAGSVLRIAAALYPVSIEGHSLCIRRHLSRQVKLSDFEFAAAPSPGSVDSASETGDWASWLAACVRERRNVLVSGATGSGKTTFANALLDRVPEQERVLSIEDTPELRIRSPNRVRFETRGADDARALLRMALRYRPDRIVVGEVRGAEAYDLLQAWNTGHPGGVSTLHADSAEDALYRLEALVTQSAEVKSWPLSAVRRACSGAVGVVVQLSKHHLCEIVAVEGVNESGGYRLRRVFSS
jgi:Flp pilus assembly CpaF family ATPase